MTSAEKSKINRVGVDFVLYKERWIVLLIYSMVGCMNGVIWISLSTITSITQEYYYVSSVSVNWLAMTYMLFYIFVVPASFILDKFGLKTTIVIGTCLNGLGSSFRCIGANRGGFLLVFTGNVLAAIAQCFILFIPPRLAAVWFGEHERATASSIGILMNMLGVAIAFMMGTIVPPGEGIDNNTIIGMHRLLISEAVISASLVPLVIILIKSKPKTPPSMSQALIDDIKHRILKPFKVEEVPMIPIRDNIIDSQCTVKIRSNSLTKTQANESNKTTIHKQDKTNFFQSSILLFKNPSFLLLCGSYGLYFGLFNAYNTILNQIVISQHPGRETEIGYMGVASVACGLLGMLLCGMFIDRYHYYRAVSMFLFGGCAIGLLIFTLLLTYVDSLMVAIVSFSLFGFFSYPYISIGLEHGAEITYPVPEGTSSGILLLFGNLTGIILTYSVGAVVAALGSNISGYIMVAGYALGFVIVTMINAPLKRLNTDNEKS